MRKIALIFGVNGQDGSYLAEFLISKGYIVHGSRRYKSNENIKNLSAILEHKNFFLHYADITDSSSVYSLIKKCNPVEIYNLAAQSHVHISFFQPEYTANVDALGHLRILESVKSINPNIKIYNASTSELFGDNNQKPQNEKTLFSPVSPYSIAKQYAYGISKIYREAYGMFICNGILFNHESPRRGISFVTRKITSAVAKIKFKKLNYFYIGNLNSKRDWGFAKEYVVPMWKMLQMKKADDYIISTGKQFSVRYFIEKCFHYVDIKIKWSGKGNKEIGKDSSGKILVKIDPYYFRPNEVGDLLGNSKKAKKILGWKPETNLNQLVKIMMDYDLNIEKND
jgi:GDPmannose 4,6-dehydratase